VSFDAAHGSFLTSHVAECPDIAPECATTIIPAHKHVVRVGLTHFEIDASYGLRDAMQLSLRVPYDNKAQRVQYTTLDGAPFTPPYGDIHHRSETLDGISDPSLVIDRALRDRWMLSIGTTLPLGHTVDDPIDLGKRGLKHEHIQFGSGTFEPLVAAQYANAKWFARVEGKFSVYEGGNGFKAPTTFIWSIGPTFRTHGIAVEPRLNGQHQSLAYWRGEVDEGSGFDNGGVRLQISVPRGELTITPGVYRELWSHGLGGQTFRQSTTWSLSLSRRFR
jgi:hypothetical protein